MSLFKSLAANIYVAGRLDCDALGEGFLRAGPAAATLLDVGCGSGELTMKWAQAARASRIVGLEFVESELQKATGRGIDARKADLSKPWPVADGECDVVISSQNIEHMHRTRFYLEEILRVLKPNGTAVILTENLSSWPNIASLVLGMQPFSLSFFDGFSVGNPFAVHSEGVTDPLVLEETSHDGVSGVVGHVRVLAYAALKDAAEKVGFRVDRYCTSGYAPFWGAASQLASRIDPCHAHFLAIEVSKPA
jgi:SAM-dependent methyltransferase